MMTKRVLLAVSFALLTIFCKAENGYRLWLRYDRVSNNELLQQYRRQLQSFFIAGFSPTIAAARKEMQVGLGGMLDQNIREAKSAAVGSIVVAVRSPLVHTDFNALGSDGFFITTAHKKIVITAITDIGLLYGVFHFLRLLQTQQDIRNLSVTSIPKIQNRILNHWDNLDRSVERGYAGLSIWDWNTLPHIDQRYVDYARADASIGINGTVLTNVNANALVLTKDYLTKVKALADVFRPYGIKVYLTARFSAPVEIGGLKTADPLDTAVQRWWKQKADEIYQDIPDFGGFLVKANSEGQPGPQSYGRSHADGANLLADALAPHHGLVMWRAFVYDVRVQQEDEKFDSVSAHTPPANIASSDRFQQAYNEFSRFDGKFKPNVLLQVKNGPIDFQPREPFSPLFGAMSKTPLSMEFQITQEYLGQGTNMVFEAPLFKEVLNADTYASGRGSTVAKVIDGSLFHHSVTAMAGVANIGSDTNWTHHPFAQANWYAFGRLAWNHDLSAAQIAGEWIRQTYSNNATIVGTVKKMMLASREAVVNYMTPLGLHHIMATGHHYGPGAWIDNQGRPDWNPVYYHKADAYGIGFDRTAAGSNGLAQYKPGVQALWADSNTCNEKYLLWFHHVSWSHKMKGGQTLWNELCTKYQQGVDTVRWMQQRWNTLENLVDKQRFEKVKAMLNTQEQDAKWWRDASLLYFQTLSKMPLPSNVEKPSHNLEFYKNWKFPYAPGNKPGN